jgi:hypothetical protein
MIKSFTKQLLSVTLSLVVIFAAVPLDAQQTGDSSYTGQGVPLTAAELQALVAPIALYPDALVAQVLSASSFPDQVAYAENWIQMNPELTGQTLMVAVNAQSWEPSVKALSQFPSVLANMAKNLSWTSSLGEAYSTQAADVMLAVQALRAKAYAAGNLVSSPQLAVVQQSPTTIVIQPVNPAVVYVPVYNPAVVYGYPYVVPAYVAPPPPPSAAATAIVAFGVGVAVGAMMSSSCCAWGYSSWSCSSTTVVYHGSAYYGNTAYHGGYYGSSASAYGAYGSAHASTGYNPSTGTYARGATVSNGYGSQSVGQAYNPHTGAYGQTEQGSNAYGSWGSSTVSKDGTTAYTQHQTNANGTTASMQATNGASAYGASGKYGNSAAVGQTANGNKYATANGNTYKNTGSGWSNTNGSFDSYKGYGSQDKSSSSAFSGSGGGGWGSRSASSRGWSSGGGGGGWGGRR